MQYRYKLMDKNKRSIQRESSGPEDNLRQLSLYDDAQGVINNSYTLANKNIKKPSIIDGWIKQKYAHETPLEAKATPLQNYHKMLKPHPYTTRSHFNHIAFSPRPLNMNEFEFDGEVTHHLTQRNKKRPFSSTLHHKTELHNHTQFEPTTIKKVNHNFLRKNSGIKNSKNTLEKGNKITVQSFTYPMFDSEFNPQKVIPHIGRISYLVKLKKRNEIVYKF